MSMMSEFRDFAMRGNVVDMAVGIVIGGAFGKIVSSFVNDVLMPPIGLALGGVDFSELALTLQEASGEVAAALSMLAEEQAWVAEQTPAAEVATTDTADNPADDTTDVTVHYFFARPFIIIAFAIFMVIKAMNKMKKKEEEAPAAPPKPSAEESLLTEIRDLLRRD